MPTNFGLKNNPSMSDYDSVPKFVPNKSNSGFEITWHNLVSAAGSSLSEEGYKQILGCKLFGDSASYYNLYKDRPLKQLVTILANRFCSDKSSDQYIQDIENFKRPDGQSLVQTLECLKYLIMQGYRNKPKEEQSNRKSKQSQKELCISAFFMLACSSGSFVCPQNQVPWANTMHQTC